MNERIRELCIKAGASPLPGSTGIFINALDPKKFAELIVLESINGLLNSYGPDDCLPQEEIAGFLKNHFGVE